MKGDKMEDEIEVKVFRYDPETDDCPRYETHEVPTEEPKTVRTLLRYIRDNYDPTLAFRDHICFKGTCSNCLIRANGKSAKACSTRVEPGESVLVEPILVNPVIKDLVVDRGVKVKTDEATFTIKEGTTINIDREE